MKRKICRALVGVMLLVAALTGCGKNVITETIQNNIETSDESDEQEDEKITYFSAQEGKYPIKWDLTTIYSDEDEWQKDYEKCMELIKEYDKFRGKLNNAKTIREYLDFAYFTDLTKTQSRLYQYVALGLALDATDATFNNLQAKLDKMGREESQRNAFADIEIFALPIEEREKIFADPLFDGDEYWLRDYLDPEYVPLTEEENLLVSTMSMGLGYGSKIYDILNNVELPYTIIEMPDGSSKELDDELLYEIMTSPVYSSKFRAEAYNRYEGRYGELSNTFAALLEENCNQAYASALINGFDSTLEEAMDDYDLDTEVFDMLIESAHKGIPEYQRYLDLHKEALGVDEQYSYMVGITVSEYEAQRVNYDDAVDEVIKALSILGDDYIDHFTKIISSDHIDVYPAENKATGAFEQKLTTEFYPWVLFNYSGYSDEISTIAHEMGHAVYDQYSTENQRQAYSSPTVFTQEVASTTNELIYYNYKLNNAKDNEEKLYYLEEAINMFAGTFFTQMMYSEFEDYMYKTVESGQALDAEDLGDKWEELSKEYRGDTIVFLPESRYQWAEIPHMYYNYYVYQYSADVAYASSIAQRINDGEEGAVSEYIEFLKKGASASPVDLLSGAGIDPLSEETYDNALAYFSSLVDEYEEIIESR